MVPQILMKGYKMNILKSVSMVDAGVTVPTPTGLPVSLQITGVVMVRLAGDIRIEGLTSLAQLFTKGTKPTLTLKTDIKPRFVVVLTITITYMAYCIH